MDLDDQEKTSFVTAQETYCYRVMPFGLKNAGATYQRLVNMMFQKQIGTTMEVYIDDCGPAFSLASPLDGRDLLFVFGKPF